MVGALVSAKGIYMAVEVTLEDDVALVLLDLLHSEQLEKQVGTAERNALWVLEGALEKRLVAPFQPDYLEQLRKARASLIERYGD